VPILEFGGRQKAPPQTSKENDSMRQNRKRIHVPVYAAKTSDWCSLHIGDRKCAVSFLEQDQELSEGEVVIRRPRASEVRERLKKDDDASLPVAVFRAMLLQWSGILDEDGTPIECDEAFDEGRLDIRRDRVIDRMGADCMNDLFRRLGFDGRGGPLKHAIDFVYARSLAGLLPD
jgi:hypothetical protein